MLCVVNNPFREMFIHWFCIWKDLDSVVADTVKRNILKQHVNQWDQNDAWACWSDKTKQTIATI